MKIKILKVFLAIAAVMACFFAQININGWIPAFTVVPNFLLIVTFSIGFLSGRLAGMLTGLLCGLLLDATSGRVLGYYTLIFIYIGYFNGALTRILVQDMVFMPIILCAVNELIYSIYIYIFSFLLYGKVQIISYLTGVVLPELILTALAAVIVYGIIMFVHRRLTDAEKKGDHTFA